MDWVDTAPHPGLYERATGADREGTGRHGDGKGPGARVVGHDRPGHAAKLPLKQGEHPGHALQEQGRVVARPLVPQKGMGAVYLMPFVAGRHRLQPLADGLAPGEGDVWVLAAPNE